MKVPLKEALEKLRQQRRIRQLLGEPPKVVAKSLDEALYGKRPKSIVMDDIAEIEARVLAQLPPTISAEFATTLREPLRERWEQQFLQQPLPQAQAALGQPIPGMRNPLLQQGLGMTAQQAMNAAAQQTGALNQQGQPMSREEFIALQPQEPGSVTQLKALQPMRVATGRLLGDGTWSGSALTDVRVLTSMFGGPHFLLQLGYQAPVEGATVTFGMPLDTDRMSNFRIVFKVDVPCTQEQMNDPAEVEKAHKIGETMVALLNMRRIP